MPTTQLFDPQFLQALESLRVLARRVPSGGRPAEQRSRAFGSGIEFTDMRPYTAGDDFRAIDWHVFQRFDKLFLRVYLQDRDLPIYFLIDQSRSMQLRNKRITALQTCAALSYVALQQMDRIAVHPFASAPLQPLPGMSGKNAFPRLLRYLEALPDGVGTELVEHVERFAARRLRHGLCVLISDCYDPRGEAAMLRALARLPHRLLIVRPVHPDEARPALGGEVEVVDCESGNTIALEVDAALLERYQRAYQEFERRLQEFAQQQRAGLLTLRSDQPLVPQIATLFSHGVMHV